MKAFILAAGMGTRLSSLNLNLPKPLIRDKRKTIDPLEYREAQRLGYKRYCY